MATYGQALTLTYTAWDTVNNTPKTGDVANHTLRWVKDGTAAATDGTAAEIDATNAPGEYKITISATEAQAVTGKLAGKSSTANIVIVPVAVTFDRLPTVAPGANGGLPTVDANNRIAGIQGTKTTLDGLNDITAASVWSVETRTLTANTNLLSAADVWSDATRTLTANTNLSIPTAADIWAYETRILTANTNLLTASAVWSDATRTLTANTNLNIPAAADIWAVETRTLTANTNLSIPSAADIWSSETRTLTAGTNLLSAADVWASETRTLTANTNLLAAADVWAAETRTLTAGTNLLSASDVWSSETRTLTAGTNISIPSAADIWSAETRTLTAGTNLSIPTTGDINTQCAAALSTYDPPTKAELDSALAGLDLGEGLASAIVIELLNATITTGGLTIQEAADIVVSMAKGNIVRIGDDTYRYKKDDGATTAFTLKVTETGRENV